MQFTQCAQLFAVNSIRFIIFIIPSWTCRNAFKQIKGGEVF